MAARTGDSNADFGLRIAETSLTKVGEGFTSECRRDFNTVINPQSAIRNFLGGGMNDSKKIVLGVGVWLVGLTGLHMALNINWKVILNDRLPEAERRLNVAYIPVT